MVTGIATLSIAFTDRVLLVGLAGVVWQVMLMSTRQRVVPNHLLGRVSSVSRSLTFGSLPAGSALGGVVAKAFGLSAPFLAGGLLPLVLAVPFSVLLATEQSPGALAAQRREVGDT